MSFSYLQYDVFTDVPLTGNQLAVFPDAGGLSAEQMQAVAREMNFSESTFILPAERSDTDVRMRIFTPGIELPMAGHPTIGSTFALAHMGVITRRQDHFVFGLGVGPTRVELTFTGDELSFAWMDQQLPEFRKALVGNDEIARAVGVDPEAITRSGLGIEEVSCGVPYVLVPLDRRKAVDTAHPDMTLLAKLKSAFDIQHVGVYLFTLEPTEPDVTAYSRMFAAGVGIVEDPATGSACGPLGCYLVRHGKAAGVAATRMVSWQGVAMGRASRIHIAIAADASRNISRVQVGGQAVLVAEGTLTF